MGEVIENETDEEKQLAIALANSLREAEAEYASAQVMRPRTAP